MNIHCLIFVGMWISPLKRRPIRDNGSERGRERAGSPREKEDRERDMRGNEINHSYLSLFMFDFICLLRTSDGLMIYSTLLLFSLSRFIEYYSVGHAPNGTRYI